MESRIGDFNVNWNLVMINCTVQSTADQVVNFCWKFTCDVTKQPTFSFFIDYAVSKDRY